MTAATRSLATALWGARFASGLLRPLLYHYPGRDPLGIVPLVGDGACKAAGGRGQR